MSLKSYVNNLNFRKVFRKENVIIFSLVLFIVSIFTYAAYITYYQPQSGIDDANITFVYAKNIANGYGFVYNAGGEHVEGASSMLWVLLTSIAFKFFTNPHFVILLFNIFILSLSITYLVKFLLRNFKGKYFKIAAVGVLLTWLFALPNFIVWGTITLMEFGLYSSILIFLTVSLLRSPYKLPIDRFIFTFSIFLLVLVRPESLLWVPVFIILYFLMQWHLTKKIKDSIKRTILPAGVGIFSIIALISFRLSYFGYPFPNTYYAKVSTDLKFDLQQGYYYLRDFIESNNFALFFIGISVAVGLYLLIKAVNNIRLKKTFLSSSELQTFIIIAVLGTGIFIPIYNGGDHFFQFRFFQPIWTFLILSGIFIFNLLGFDLTKIRVNKLPLIIVGLTSAFIIFYVSNDIQWHKYKTQKNIDLTSQFEVEIHQGEEFNQFYSSLDKLPTIGVLAAGGFKLNYNGPVNDLLGLNNVAMAHATGIKNGFKNHSSFNKDVFLQQLPDFFAFVRLPSFDIPQKLVTRDSSDFSYQILQGLYDDDKFKELYTPAVIYNSNMNYYMFAYYNKEFLNSLPNTLTYKVYQAK